MAEATAREFGMISLEEALGLTALVAERELERGHGSRFGGCAGCSRRCRSCEPVRARLQCGCSP